MYFHCQDYSVCTLFKYQELDADIFLLRGNQLKKKILLKIIYCNEAANVFDPSLVI